MNRKRRDSNRTKERTTRNSATSGVSVAQFGRYGFVWTLRSNLEPCFSADTVWIDFVRCLPRSIALSKSICRGEVFQYGDTLLRNEGIYRFFQTNTEGCRDTSVLTLRFKRSDSTTLRQQICWGQSYRFNNQNLKTSGIYRQILTNTEGCDSLIVLELTVLSQNLAANPSVFDPICKAGQFKTIRRRLLPPNLVRGLPTRRT